LDVTVLSTKVYSLYGDSEEVLGKWFKRTGRRHEIFLATKFGFVKDSKTLATDTSAEYTKKCCYASLEALGIESIDLCKFVASPPLNTDHRLCSDVPDYVHSVNPETPIEETMRALAELQAYVWRLCFT
jgi:aryl-alcohol dehydrogenase-like predicted oxidoreductase